MTERLFLAVALDGAVRRDLDARLEDVRPLPGKPVPPENWHITLRFLGATDEVARDRILGALDQAELPAPFPMRFADLGAFPRPRRATVLWLGVGGGSDEVAALAAACEEAAQAAGVEPEDRPFHAHLTLARIRPWQDLTPVLEPAVTIALTQTVDRITLYRSVLGGGPARYEVVDQVEL